ncbi:PspC domain-containing protein [Conexibacter sp. JD483]|uniref:PspC domain-containing protein n=1 Tax=unclassified Conexibacter TaxID=2627773 RepID=UPI002718DF46|nr:MULTISPECIES: PspC domain-containing protein [unclassified Conexibacter]MDO8188643.1 PspC domain-containing protein [Conexibacter sp. CPCC 205706]MDO8201521.1 PspC domain-containing protein [Conexibacter sp. CPCC 205762]MDR9370740.1 PspC domain-containing protein [Conexibacter sp. JD483]
MSAGPSHPGALPQPLRRARDGAWLGGVCRGMANRWSTPVAQLRALFVVASLFAGLGLLAYAACWLVLPTDADEDSPSLLRGVASVALLIAALAGLATVAAVTAAATLFGFGWAIAVALAAFLLGALVLLPSVSPAWVLPPLLAAALPAVVVAASGVRVEPQAGLVTERPQTAAEIPAGGYRTGLGDLFVDLRELRAAPGEVVPLKLETGFGRTVVALPRDRCFAVEVRYEAGVGGWDSVRSLAQSVRLRSPVRSRPAVVLFGDPRFGRSGAWRRAVVRRHVPLLRVDYRTVGGDLWLRDYPSGVGPLADPWWSDVAGGGDPCASTPTLHRRGGSR